MIIRHYRLGIMAILSMFILSPAQAGPLHDAAKNGDLGEIKRLIAQGADVNARDKYGKTALIRASNKGHGDIVKVLLAEGADVNAKSDKGWTALMAASMKVKGNVITVTV